MREKNIGSDFDEFLKEEGIFEDAQETAVKRVLAYQVEQAMRTSNLTKTAMAKRMRSSRCALDRLLDPRNESVTLQTMKKAAFVLGRTLKIELA